MSKNKGIKQLFDELLHLLDGLNGGISENVACRKEIVDHTLQEWRGGSQMYFFWITSYYNFDGKEVMGNLLIDREGDRFDWRFVEAKERRLRWRANPSERWTYDEKPVRVQWITPELRGITVHAVQAADGH